MSSSSPNCCSKLTEAVISCVDLESQCVFWNNWLNLIPKDIDQKLNHDFTNKDFIYRNAFYSHEKLDPDKVSDPWFFYLNADADDHIEMSACSIKDLIANTSDNNSTIVRFLAKKDPRYFLLVLRRRGVLLLFIKAHNIVKHLQGDRTDVKKAYQQFCAKFGVCLAKSNFLADDDEDNTKE